jgi:hypothetical protein
MITTATLNPIATWFANLFMRVAGGFVSDGIFPEFPAPMQSANYYVFEAGDAANVPLLVPRAPGAPYQRIQTKLGSDTYNCENFGLEAPAPDEERKKYGAYFDLDKLKVNRITDTIRVNNELRAVGIINGLTTAAAIAIPWNDPASNPKGDVDAAKEEVRKSSGMRATTLVISEPTFLVLQYHPKLVDLFKFTTPGVLNEQKLAAYFGLQEVLVAWNVQATNNEGQVFTASDIWGNMAFVAAVSRAQDLEVPTFGRRFHWTAFTSEVTTQDSSGPTMAAGGGGPELMQIFTYRDEAIKSDVHRGDNYVAEKVVAGGAGYRLDGCLA